jgi:hypothetical protein
MKRLLTQGLAAVVIFGMGWLAARAAVGFQESGTFKLTIDAPAGETRLKCEGCQFLTWTPEGRAGERQSVINFSCSHGPCAMAFGAVAILQEPKLMADLNEKAEP